MLFLGGGWAAILFFNQSGDPPRIFFLKKREIWLYTRYDYFLKGIFILLATFYNFS